MWDGYEDYEDYEDYVTSRSEFDAVVSEAENKIRNLFVERVNNAIEEAKEAEKELAELKQEIRSLERQKKQKEKELQDAIEKLENAELNDIPKRYIDKFVRSATKGLAPNDEVWIVESKYEKIPCEFCNGKGKVSAVIGDMTKEMNCPECNGAGTKSKYTYYPYKTYVTDIHLKLCFDNENRVHYWDTKNVYVRGREGYISKGNFFASEEEAKAEADRRNQKRE